MNSPIYLSMPVPDTEDSISVPLERICVVCGGRGTREDQQANAPRSDLIPECVECEGRGVIPTHFGLQVLNFVRRWQS